MSLLSSRRRRLVLASTLGVLVSLCATLAPAPSYAGPSAPAERVVDRWFHLSHEGTSDGTAWGFEHSGWVGIAGEWEGSDGFESTVSGAGDVDSATFALKGQCSRFTVGVGGESGAGQARVAILVDGEQRFTRDLSDDQSQGVALDVRDARTLQVTSTSLSDATVTIGLGDPKILCRSTFTAEPRDTRRRHWVDLSAKGTSGGDADGFAASGWVGLAGKWEGTDGYEATVSEDDIEDWASFRVPGGCTRLAMGIGGTSGAGAAVVQVFRGGKLALERDLSEAQVHAVALGVKDARSVKVVVTSISQETVTIALGAPRLYCAR